MDHVRIVSAVSEPQACYPLNASYIRVVSIIDDWWSHFFDESVDRLTTKIGQFLGDHADSPFPVIVQVLPPQEEGDSLPFERALARLGIPLIQHQLFHIQQDRLILFHSSPPPSDIPRVLGCFFCIEELPLFKEFLTGLLSILFGLGLTPQNSFVGAFRSLYFDKFRSFSFLLTIIKQSLLIHFQNHSSEQFSELFECPVVDHIQSFLTKQVHTRELPSPAVVKFRQSLMTLLDLLSSKFETPPILLDVLRFEDIGSCRSFRLLIGRLSEISDDTVRDFIILKEPLFRPLFEGGLADEGPRLKSRRGRFAALTGQTAGSQTCSMLLERVIAKAFLPLPEDSPCEFLLCETASFDPRRAMRTVMTDKETTHDTATVYQILEEQPGRAVELTDLLEAFSAKTGVDSQAIALSRVEVAISELEYLGFVDRKGRRKGGLRRILRV
jgi:hypothetical protein